MPFQTSVNRPSIGRPGDIISFEPTKVKKYILTNTGVSGTPPHVVGSTAYTILTSQAVSGGDGKTAIKARPGGTAFFLGILCNPSAYALPTSYNFNFTPTLNLPNETDGELITMGSIVAQFAANTTANIGDNVIYDNATGKLEILAAGATLPTGKSFAFAKVTDLYITAANPVGIISLMPNYTLS